MDPRHVTIHMASFADTTRALARDKNKITNSLFRLFHWTPNFKIGKDSSMEAVWVKLHNLPLQYYNETYARICFELDVSKPMLDAIFVGMLKDQGWFQEIEYEGNNAYCTYCGLLGHVIGLCHKKAQIQGKSVAADKKNYGDNKGPLAPVTILK